MDPARRPIHRAVQSIPVWPGYPADVPHGFRRLPLRGETSSRSKRGSGWITARLRTNRSRVSWMTPATRRSPSVLSTLRISPVPLPGTSCPAPCSFRKATALSTYAITPTGGGEAAESCWLSAERALLPDHLHHTRQDEPHPLTIWRILDFGRTRRTPGVLNCAVVGVSSINSPSHSCSGTMSLCRMARNCTQGVRPEGAQYRTDESSGLEYPPSSTECALCPAHCVHHSTRRFSLLRS